MRTIWRGTLRFGEVAVPVGLASASAPSGGPKLREVHTCGRPIAKRSVCPEHGELEKGEVVRGFESGGGIVIPDADELAAAAPVAAKTIEVFAFVGADELDPMLTSKPYYLVPDDQPAGRRAYAVLRQALLDAEVCALARYVAFNTEYVAAIDVLSPESRALVVWTLHFREDVVSSRPVEELDWDAVEPKPGELKQARAFVRALRVPLEEADLSSRYRTRLQELLEQTVSPPKRQRRSPATA